MAEQPKNPRVTVRSVGPKICEALGLDPSMVRDITIMLNVDDVPRVSVVGYVRRDECDALTKVLTEFKLVDPTPYDVG